MRFLFGIVIGAALTLLIATTTDAPTNPVLERVTGLWEQLIDTTSERLFDRRAHTLPSSATVSAARNVDNLMETAVTPSTPLSAQQQTEDLRGDPAEQPVAQTEDPTQPLEQAGQTARNPTEPAPDVPLEISVEQIPEASPTDTAATSKATYSAMPAPADNQIATVWVPFHSERSANGFASTLSRHFEYPFSVRRNGPGAYQVTFSYADLAQRETLLMSIAELTGK